MAYGRGRRRARRAPRREFEWSRSQGFVGSSADPGGVHGVDLLAFYRSQPNGNHLAATITRVRGWIYPDWDPGVPTFQIANAGLRIANFDEDATDVSNAPINGPDEDWLGWFPTMRDAQTDTSGSLPNGTITWNEGGYFAVDVKAARKLNGRQRSLWLFCDPPAAGTIFWNYNLSVGMKLH